jgi:carboxyl-terminal processing protease
MLQRGMIQGMVAKLGDPFTTYNEPTLHELQSNDLSGEYGGIGAYISKGDDGRIYLIPFKDGPAERAGIQEGDVLVAVDFHLIETDIDLNDVVVMIRGEVGSKVTLILASRGTGEDSLVVEVIREAFPIPSVSHYVLPAHPTVGVIVINLFSEKTPQEVEEAFLDLLERNVKGMVLDLRDNAGGLLDSGIAVARFFLDEGIILIEERRSKVRETYAVEMNGLASDIPLVVLVNSRTASAAEVVAAAIQSNQRAPLVGRPTFGKGSVQLIFELDDRSSLHVTSARWLTPTGMTLDQNGLQPDITVQMKNNDIDLYMLTAVEYLMELE